VESCHFPVKSSAMQRPIPGRYLILIYAVTWVLAYWAVYFFFRSLLPQKDLVDASIIQEIAEGLRTGEVNSYALTGAFFALLPLSVTTVLVGLFDGYILYRITSSACTFRGMLLLVPIMAPFVGLNLQAPTKETVVLAITLLISYVAQRVRADTVLIAVIVIIYGLYGAFFREYYLLILAAFLGFYVMSKAAPTLRWTYLLLAFVVLLLLPEQIYGMLQGPRDETNFWIGFGAAEQIRTIFRNPFPPDGPWHFLGNYAYAFAVLHFPFFLFTTVKEFLMFVNILFYGWLLFTGLKLLKGPLRLLLYLFAAHVVVLVLFEPDLGSFFRHFSSAFLYLLPVFKLQELRYAYLLGLKETGVQRTAVGVSSDVGIEEKGS